MPDDPVLGREKMPRHRAAHRPEADNAYLFYR
jgi:hypothetical protein